MKTSTIKPTKTVYSTTIAKPIIAKLTTVKSTKTTKSTTTNQLTSKINLTTKSKLTPLKTTTSFKSKKLTTVIPPKSVKFITKKSVATLSLKKPGFLYIYFD